MRSVTKKHFSIVNGLPRFAQVTVARLEASDDGGAPANTIVNDHVFMTVIDHELIEAARQGVRESEVALGWRGPPHYVAKIEGPVVDFHPDAAHLAAAEATKVMIQL